MKGGRIKHDSCATILAKARFQHAKPFPGFNPVARLTGAARSEANATLAASRRGEMGVKPLGNARHTMALFTEQPERELRGAKQHITV